MATSPSSSIQGDDMPPSPQHSPIQPRTHRRHVIQGIDKLPIALDLEASGGGVDEARNDEFRENEPLVRQNKDRSGPMSRFAVETRSDGPSPGGIIQRLTVGGYFALWYALNVIYNILNKKVLNVLPAPLTVASIQLAVGATYASTLWGLGIRPAPRLTSKGMAMVRKVGAYHAAGQVCTVVSLGAGPVSFTHIVKAMEPFFSAAVSAAVFGMIMRPQVYATLLPVVGGVSYACAKEPSFTWLAFLSAMGSNLAFALRAVQSKSAMADYVGDHVTPANLFGAVTCFGFVLSAIPAFVFEGASFWKLLAETPTEKEGDGGTMTLIELVGGIILSGVFHYLNNEVMYLALGKVHPVTLAVGNTMKRVFILVASVIVFRNPVTLQAAVGSTVGLVGVLLYSLTKQHYEKLDAAANKSAPSSPASSR